MLEPDSVVAIADKAARCGYIDNSVIASLREAYPAVHFTYCMDDDVVNAKPVLERELFNVYLIDGREHCLCLTNNYDTATGVVIAERVDDEE